MLAYQDPSVNQQVPVGVLEGLTLNYVNATDIEILAGRAFVPVGTQRLPAVLATAQTRSLNQTWSQAGPGGRASGVTLTANTTYHVFLLRRDVDGAISFLFDTSITAANRPVGWNARMIASIMTDASSNIIPFIQVGDRFEWQNPITDLNVSTLTTTTTNLVTLTTPLGIALLANVIFDVGRTGQSAVQVGGGSSLASSAPTILQSRVMGLPNDIAFTIPGELILTNTSRQIRLYASSPSTSMTLRTTGFIHPRGS